MSILLTAVISMGIMGAFFATILAIASLKFSVEVDPRIEKIEELLPGANCGSCSLPGCGNLAEAIVKGNADISLCPAAGEEVIEEIASIMGVEAAAAGPRERAFLLCGGGRDLTTSSNHYGGIKTCKAANSIPGGSKDCQFGCLGFGDCTLACPFQGITMTPEGLPSFNTQLCTACGKCQKACPRNLIIIAPVTKDTVVACKATYPGKKVRSICQVGCIGCQLCVKVCPVEAIAFQNNLAVIDFDKCINCGLCAKKCPTKAIAYFRPFMNTIQITSDCTGCTLCRRKCPVQAITGDPKEVHQIDVEKCIQCGICYEVCKKDAIVVEYDA